MRLKRISLLALMSLVVASGCSANRNAATSLRGEREHVTEPPRRNHEYNPALTPGDDGFIEPPSEEPALTPPALGVSRVKSVSWLRDFGSKKREVPAPELSCSDEELIGRCSPIEPCVPNSECGAQSFGTPSSDNPRNASPLARMQKSVSRMFGRKSTLTTTPDFRDRGASGSGTTPDVSKHNSALRSRLSSELPEQHSHETVDSEPTSRLPRHVIAQHPGCRNECPAEPSVESVFDPAEPGLITPAVGLRPEPEQSFDPGVKLPGPKTDAPSPEPAQPTLPISEAPQIEILAPAPTEFVEPQLWPKLEERAEILSISQSISRATRPPAATKTPSASAQMPPLAPSGSLLVIPRPHQ